MKRLTWGICTLCRKQSRFSHGCKAAQNRKPPQQTTAAMINTSGMDVISSSYQIRVLFGKMAILPMPEKTKPKREPNEA